MRGLPDGPLLVMLLLACRCRRPIAGFTYSAAAAPAARPALQGGRHHQQAAADHG